MYEPQSAYVALSHKGKTVHLFNAARFPLGRMAVLISTFIRGTHKPGYTPNQHDHGDVCIVVNDANTKVTGRKRFLMKYRYHTGYPGKLHEIPMETLLEKHPD